ncbi:glycoside hydrolase family 3 C-terminal domain-containing protein [Nonomuraea angiospora]|uniref:glycoside hydrolase family 3 C-terminal domain-containing protein n=1 Tax=Nonomuraea angiospora TaxID=46172 RepID=UPI00379472D9
MLPLDRDGSIAVVGELARTPRYQGAGSSQIVPTRLDDALSELRALAGRDLPFAPGYPLDGDRSAPGLVEEARGIARNADTTVVFLGLPAGAESEGYDRTGLDLPPGQVDLLRAVAETGTRVVVVLSNGGVVQVAEWDHLAAAVLEGWLLGQAGGGALADVLFGVVNPSGRLAETIPLRLADTPSYLNFPGDPGSVRYGEGVFVGYRYHDAVGGPVSYPFGHGLSYTEFGYAHLEADVTGDDERLRAEVSVRITNLGERPGQEVVQLYVSAPSQVVRRPEHELRGFRKVALDPGQSATVRFELGWRDFAYFHPVRRSWTVEPGTAVIHVGGSSRDIRQSLLVKLDITPVRERVTPDSPLEEWVAVPGGLEVLLREMRPPAETGLARSRFLTDGSLRTMGSVPLRRLARFPGAYLDPDRLDELAAEVNAKAQP